MTAVNGFLGYFSTKFKYATLSDWYTSATKPLTVTILPMLSLASKAEIVFSGFKTY